MAQLKPPIILVGNYRSGTTMTALCFDQLDEIAIWREPRTIWTLGNAGRPHDRFTEELATPRVIKRIRNAFRDYQQANGGRRVMEKTPSNTLRVPFIRKVFPEARFIHLIRDGRDNISSASKRWSEPINRRRLKRRLLETPVWEWPKYLPRFLHDHVGMRLGLTKHVQSWGVVYPGMAEDKQRLDLIEVVAKQWVAAVETAWSDFRTLEDSLYVECHYEDFVEEPHQWFERFLELTELEMTDDLVDYLSTEIRRDAIGVWRERLDSEQIALVEPIIRPTMERVGYSMDTPDPRPRSVKETASRA
ncbi:MAG: sulfotransferase family protein [Phycisphaerales bacterium]